MDYDRPVERLFNAVVLNRPEIKEDHGQSMDSYKTVDNLWAQYLGIPQKYRKYKDQADGVTQYTENGVDYVSLNNQNVLWDDIQPTLLGGSTKHISPRGWKYESDIPAGYGENRNVRSNFVLGDFQTMRKVDPINGEYVQYSDRWDINPYQKTDNIYGQVPYEDMPWYDKIASKIVNKYLQKHPDKDSSFGIGNPLNIKGRIYLEDKYGIPKGSSAPNKGDYFGGWLPEINVIKHKKVTE